MKLQLHTTMTVSTFITIITVWRLAPIILNLHHRTCSCSVKQQRYCYLLIICCQFFFSTKYDSSNQQFVAHTLITISKSKWKRYLNKSFRTLREGKRLKHVNCKDCVKLPISVHCRNVKNFMGEFLLETGNWCNVKNFGQNWTAKLQTSSA